MNILGRIKREARKSPAKAAVLVGLAGFAMYSWAPLLAGFFAADEEPPTSAVGQPTPGDARQAAAKPGATAAQKRPTWRQVCQWREDSPWTAPAELGQLRDPFRLAAEAGLTAADRQKKETEEPAPVTPQQAIAGLAIQLSGTIVTPKRRVAILDGRAYREGDTIRVEQPDTTWEMEIRRIEPNRVILGWQSIERELVPPERPQVGRIELLDRSRK